MTGESAAAAATGKPERELRILMMTQTLELGGGVVAPVRLARGLARKHRVMFAVQHLDHQHPAMVEQLAGIPAASCRWNRPPWNKWLYRVARPWARRNGRGNPFLEWVDASWLRALHRRHCFDAVSTHLFGQELRACRAFFDVPLAIVASDHGDCHLPEIRSKLNDPTLQRLLQRTDALVSLCDANLKAAAAFPRRPDCLRPIIYNGMELPGLPLPSPTRPKPHVTFGMVARGHPDKGWAEALTAFLALVKSQAPDTLRLVFVGGGPEMQHLEAGLPEWARPLVTFAGEQADPGRWIQDFDVGLLPSCFALESVPYSIIEYLAWGKAVIATNVGGIREMLQTPDGPAGIVVPLDANGRASVEKLITAMTTLCESPYLRQELARCAVTAREKFRLENSVAAYERVFREAASRRRRHPASEMAPALPGTSG